MKTVIKRIVKVVSFVLVFVLLFYACQYVFHYRWSGEEDLYTRYVDFEKQPENSLDVLYFGTSEMYEGVDPIITYASEGITGYNLAVTYTSAVTNYYQLMYTLKHQTPKIVACDFASLFDNNLPSDNEQIYRKIYETLPDQELKDQLLDDIMRLDNTQDFLSWKFPFLRYHSMWSEYKNKYLLPDKQYNNEYKTYTKGALMNSKSFTGDVFKITPDLWETEETDDPLSDISVEYYDRFIEACQNRGIKVLAIIPPKIWYASECSSRWKTMKAYFDSRSVDYLNYNTYEQVTRMNLNFEDHYFDTAHLNTLGAFIFSKTLASDMKDKYNLSDHRDDTNFDSLWKDDYEILKEEISAQQPDLYKSLAIISELNMDAFIYVNDSSILNYEMYSKALEKLGVNVDRLSEKGSVFINHNDSVVQYYQVSESDESNVGNVVLTADGEGSDLYYNGERMLSISTDETGMYVVAVDSGNAKCVMNYQKP